MSKLEQLKEVFAKHLTRIRNEQPDAYVWPIEELPKVIERMHAAIDRHKGITGINIDSPTFRAAAKELGIKNTQKAWRAWLTT